ncbi:MAG TPA: phosphodiester glycosidase family protein [Thermosynechococcaceae cyanobacterium]
MKASEFALLLLGLGSIGLLVARSFPSTSIAVSPSSSIAASPSPKPTLQYQVYPLSQAIVHTLTIPPSSQFSVVPAIASTTATVEEFAQTHRAIAVLNAGFFDPQNQKTTSYITIASKRVADPQQNERLMENPKLASYLDRILNRSEFRRYQCGQAVRYDITFHSQPLPAGCELRDAIGAGPQILPLDTSQPEGFTEFAKGERVRDALGSTQPNARTAIGLKRDGSIVWVMAAQKPGNPARSGFTFLELAAFLKTLDVEKALNLDGGSSSSLYYQGTAHYGKLDSNARPVQRSVKSVLLVPSP